MTSYKKMQRILWVGMMFIWGVVPVYGNEQKPIESFDQIKLNGAQLSSEEDRYEVNVTLSWTEAKLENLPEEHPVEGYTIYFDNGTDEVMDQVPMDLLRNQVVEDGQKREWTGRLKFSAGGLYKVRIYPYHYHYIYNEDGILIDKQKIIGEESTSNHLYFMTEPQVKFEQRDGKITVLWEDMNSPTDSVADEIQYRIRYTSGSIKENKPQFEADPSAIELPLLTRSHPEVEKVTDKAGRRWLKYTLNEKAKAGAVYSFLVESERSVYKGRNVFYNKNNPNVWYYLALSDLSYVELNSTLRLEWKVESTGAGIGGDLVDYVLADIRLLEVKENEEEIIAILGKEAGEKGYYIVNKPNNVARYRLAVTYQREDSEGNLDFLYANSNEVVYIPSELKVVPARPYVPEMITREMFESYTSVSELEKHLLPSVTYTHGMEWENFKQSQKGFYLETEGEDTVHLVWGAFRRYSIDEGVERLITDLNVSYDVWVSDTLESLEKEAPMLMDISYTEVDDEHLIYDESGETIHGIQGFRIELDRYYNSRDKEYKPLEGNTPYYIKIQGKKRYEEDVLLSKPTIVSLYYDDNGLVYVPPVMSTPPLNVVQTTETTASLAGKIQWDEVMAVDAESEIRLFDHWSHRIYVEQKNFNTLVLSDTPFENGISYWVDNDRDTNRIFLVEKDNPSQKIEIKESTVVQVVKKGDVTKAIPANVHYRQVDLGGVSEQASLGFKFRYVPYSEVLEALEVTSEEDVDANIFAEYVRQLGNQEQGWKDITDQIETKEGEEFYLEEGLMPNSRYLFLVQPYRRINKSDVELKAYYPSSIIVVTKPEDEEVLPTPKIPFLEIGNHQEQSVDAYWFYNRGYIYEIRYGRDDVFETTKEAELNISSNLETGKQTFVLDDLFPDTGYYFYIRATNPDTGISSEWSNPVYGKTLDVLAPPYPRGVGVPSSRTMKRYGYERGVGSDYIGLEWLRENEFLDYENRSKDKDVQRYYGYSIDVSEDEAFTEFQNIQTGEINAKIPNFVEMLETNLIKVNQRIPHREYYFRVKTVVTVIGKEEGQHIVKSSYKYSPTIKIRVEPSENEYDGQYGLESETLPKEDYALTYDRENQALFYRFRSQEKDENGKQDNGVDQRLISSWINKNMHTYTVDVSRYGSKSIQNRKVHIPYSVIEGLATHQVTLEIDAGGVRVSIPPEVWTNDIKNKGKNVEIELETMKGYGYSEFLNNGLTLVTVPQKIRMRVFNEQESQNMDYVYAPITYMFRTNAFYGQESQPIAYAVDGQYKGTSMTGVYKPELERYIITTKNLGTYGVFVRKERSELGGMNQWHWSAPYKQQVERKYTVVGMENYSLEAGVSEKVFLNIISGIIQKSDTIDVQQPVTKEQLNRLYYSGIRKERNKEEGYISREEAIGMMIEAMDIREGYGFVATSQDRARVEMNGNISEAYKQSIGKAVTENLISDLDQLRPKEVLTYGELFALWAKAEQL